MIERPKSNIKKEFENNGRKEEEKNGLRMLHKKSGEKFKEKEIRATKGKEYWQKS